MERTNPKAEDVIAHADRCWGTECPRCGTVLIGHDAVLGLMLGFADEPLCACCIAKHVGREPMPFLENAYQSVCRLSCYRAGWAHSDARLAAAGPWPEERIPARLRMLSSEDDDEPENDSEDDSDVTPGLPTPDEVSLDAALPAETEWDAGDRGCGELALELKLRVQRLVPGARMLLTTLDAGAPADIPAWCRLTRNPLVAAEPPRFLIERRPSAVDSPKS